MRAVEAVQLAFATRLESVQLSLPYFSVLSLLLESDGSRLPMSRIARDLAMTSGGFTKLADRMARDGLIDRRGSAGDRRVVFAALTELGHAQALLAVDLYRSFLRQEVLRRVSRADLATVAAAARQLPGPSGDEDADVANFELTSPANRRPERRSGPR